MQWADTELTRTSSKTMKLILFLIDYQSSYLYTNEFEWIVILTHNLIQHKFINYSILCPASIYIIFRRFLTSKYYSFCKTSVFRERPQQVSLRRLHCDVELRGENLPVLIKDDTVRIEILFPAKSKNGIENTSFFKQNNPISPTLSYLKRRNLI